MCTHTVSNAVSITPGELFARVGEREGAMKRRSKSLSKLLFKNNTGTLLLKTVLRLSKHPKVGDFNSDTIRIKEKTLTKFHNNCKTF